MTTHRPHGRQPKRPLTKRQRLIADAIGQGAPELLTDVDFTMRTRARPQQREKKEVQQPLVVYLRKHLPAGSIVHAQAIQPLNENHRFAMQRDGVQFGYCDVEIIVPTHRIIAPEKFTGGVIEQRHKNFKYEIFPRYFHIECKHPDGGKLSPSQEHTQALLTAAGCEVMRECRSVESAIEWLRSRGVIFSS